MGVLIMCVVKDAGQCGLDALTRQVEALRAGQTDLANTLASHQREYKSDQTNIRDELRALGKLFVESDKQHREEILQQRQEEEERRKADFMRWNEIAKLQRNADQLIRNDDELHRSVEALAEKVAQQTATKAVQSNNAVVQTTSHRLAVKTSVWTTLGVLIVVAIATVVGSTVTIASPIADIKIQPTEQGAP
jgi:hypothetical protein